MSACTHTIAQMLFANGKKNITRQASARLKQSFNTAENLKNNQAERKKWTKDHIWLQKTEDFKWSIQTFFLKKSEMKWWI